MRQRNYKIILTVALGLLLSFSAAQAKNFTIYNAATPSQSYFTVNGTSGNVGLGITNPTTLLQILNNGWISAQNNAGTGVVNMFKVNASDQIEVGAPLNIGSFEFSPDSGLVSFVDMPVTSAAASGTPEGYAFKIDGDNIFTAYSESNGVGGIQNKRLGIGLTNPTATLDIAGALRNTLSTTHSLLGGSGNVLVMADNSGNLYATSTAGFGGGSGLWSGTLNGNIWNGDAGVGNVGIGTTNPTAQLMISSSATSTLTLNSSTAVAGAYSGLLKFQGGSSADYAWAGIAGVKESIYTDQNSLAFFTSLGGSTPAAERMRIRNNGNVGIGNTNPTDLLVVGSSSATSDQHISIDAAAGGEAGLEFRSAGSGSSWLYRPASSTDLRIYNISGGDVATFQQGGNVGIGTTAPSAAFHVLRSSGETRQTIETNSGTATLNLDGSGTGNAYVGSVRFANNNDSVAYVESFLDGAVDSGNLIFETQSAGTMADRMIIRSNGNVGIGSNSPTTKFYVAGTSLNTLATTHSLLGGGGNVLVMADNTGALYTTSTASFLSGNSGWTVNGTNVYKTDINGNIGIGTTAPTEKLHIAGSLKIDAGSSSNNLLVNGSLNLGTTGWSVYNNSGNGASSSLSADAANYVSYPNGLSLAVTNGGSSASDIQLSNVMGAYKLINGRWYTYSFWAKVSSGTYTTGGYIGMSGSPYTSYVGTNFTLTTTWQKFTRSFQFTGTNSDSQRIDLFLGGASASGLTIYIDNVTISPGAVSPESQPMAIFDDGTVIMEGNIGIGATAPKNKLDVAGSLAVGSYAGVNTAPSNNLIVSGNVGIGTSNPTDNLVIYNNSTGAAMEVKNSSTTAAVEAWAGSVGIGSYSNHPIAFLIGDVDKAFLDVNGNFGIGTSNPTTKLYTAGTSLNTLATTHSLLGGAGNVVVMADNTGALYATSTASLLSGGTSLWSGTKNGTIYNGDAGAGNVGIGITNPAAKLDVVGEIRVESNPITIYNGGGVGVIGISRQNDVSNASAQFAAYGGIGFTAGTVGAITPTSTSSHMWIATNGNIGIGSYSPGAKLSVAGSILGITDNSFFGMDTTNPPRLGYTKKAGYAPKLTHGSSTNFVISRSSGGDIGSSNTFTDEFVINGSGYIGVGTTNPWSRLTARATTSEPSITRGAPAIFSVSSDVGAELAITNSVNYPWSISMQVRDIPEGSSDAAYPLALNPLGGNVGIGLTSPTTKLDVSGTLRNTLATTHSLLGGSGDVLVMADNSGNLYATSTAGFLGGGGSYLPLTGGSLSGNLNMGGNNITNINKLTVNTIDPLYNIQGVNYSTFASAIAGGVKEEYLGRAKINIKAADGEREYILDFNKQPVGSDLWVWRKTVDFSADNVEVLITPYGNFAQVYYKIENNKIIFRADKSVEVSYRLSGRRIDWMNWPTKAHDQNEKAGFVIE